MYCFNRFGVKFVSYLINQAYVKSAQGPEVTCTYNKKCHVITYYTQNYYHTRNYYFFVSGSYLLNILITMKILSMKKRIFKKMGKIDNNSKGNYRLLLETTCIKR